MPVWYVSLDMGDCCMNTVQLPYMSDPSVVISTEYNWLNTEHFWCVGAIQQIFLKMLHVFNSVHVGGISKVQRVHNYIYGIQSLYLFYSKSFLQNGLTYMYMYIVLSRATNNALQWYYLILQLQSC